LDQRTKEGTGPDRKAGQKGRKKGINLAKFKGVAPPPP